MVPESGTQDEPAEPNRSEVAKLLPLKEAWSRQLLAGRATRT